MCFAETVEKNQKQITKQFGFQQHQKLFPKLKEKFENTGNSQKPDVFCFGFVCF